MTACSEHPSAPAAYRCDGCGRNLCTECIEEGHRLLTCSSCGELALPLDVGTASTAPQLQVDRARAVPYSLPQAFAYVFRGRGLHVFGSYLAALAILAFLSIFPIVGCVGVILSSVLVIAVMFIVPSTLALIVRATARGDNELPDWPDFYSWDRVAEIFSFLVTVLVAVLPMGIALQLAGCVGAGSSGPHCWLVLCGGWLLAMALWVPAFGALSVSQNLLLALRIDRHIAVLAGFGSEVWTVVLLSTALVLAGQVLAFMATALPVIGLVASAAVGMYGWFTTAHLIGVFFRRHASRLAAIYSGP